MDAPTAAEMDALRFAAEHGVEFDDVQRGVVVRLMNSLDGFAGDIIDAIAAAQIEELVKLKGVGPKTAAEIVAAAQAIIAERE